MDWSWVSFWIGVATAEFVTVGLWWVGWKIADRWMSKPGG